MFVSGWIYCYLDSVLITVQHRLIKYIKTGIFSKILTFFKSKIVYMLENTSTSDSFYFDQNSNQIKDILKYVISIFVSDYYRHKKVLKI